MIVMHLSMSRQWGGDRQGFDPSLWPGRAFQLSLCPGVGIFDFFSCP